MMKLVIVVLGFSSLVTGLPRVKRQSTSQTPGNVASLPSLLSLFNMWTGQAQLNADIHGDLPFGYHITISSSPNNNSNTNTRISDGQSEPTSSTATNANANPFALFTALPLQLLGIGMEILQQLASPAQPSGESPPITSSPVAYRCMVPDDTSRIGQERVQSPSNLALATAPAHAHILKVDDENDISQITYGYNLDGSTIIHSILASNTTNMKSFIDSNMNRLSKPSGRAAGDMIHVKDEMLLEYGLTTLTSMATKALKSLGDDMDIASALDCKTESMNCMFNSRESSEVAMACAERLCTCFADVFKDGK